MAESPIEWGAVGVEENALPSAWGAVLDESPKQWGAALERSVPLTGIFTEESPLVQAQAMGELGEAGADSPALFSDQSYQARVASRLGIPGSERLTGDLIEGPSPEQMEKPLLSLSDRVKNALGKGATMAVGGPLSLLLPKRVSEEVGESLGGLAESATSPAGIASLPAAMIAPAVVLPEMIKGGLEAGAQQIAEGKPFAGATTLAVAASPVAALGARGLLPKTKAAVEQAKSFEQASKEASTPKPVTSEPAPPEPVGTPEIVEPRAQPPPLPGEPASAPATQQSIWQRLISKHFETTKPPEVFASTSPVDAPTLDTLASAIKSSKPARRETEALRQVERAKRAEAQAGIQSGTPGRAGIGQLKSALAGELPRIDLEPFADKLTPLQQDALYNHIYGHQLLEGDVYRRSNLAIALQNLMENGQLPQPNQVAWFERIFGPQVAQSMLGKQRVASRSLRALAEIANIPRAMVTGFDLSATGRQGFSLGVAHPEIASQAFQAQIKAFADRDYAVALDRSFRVGDRARVREQAGLDLPSIEGMADFSREEVFTSRLIQSLQHTKGKTPLAKAVLMPVQAYAKGLARSERAYATYLNWLRTNVFDSMDATLKDMGLPEDILNLKRHQLAMLLNSATGRGNVPSNALLNAFFFSPKFTASRFEYPTRVSKVALSDRSVLGREARRQLASHAAAWTSLFTLMHLASKAFEWDVDFGYDPRSSDFLKVRAGNATIDTGAGYGQPIRLMARFLTGETVDSTTGKARRTEQESEVGRFLRYKLAPVPGEIFSIAKGKYPDSEEPSLLGTLEHLTVPITVQQAKDIWDEFGAAGLPLLAPEVLGFGVNVQNQEPKR